jgi:4-hydroxybenzoyl-CoA reductase subunit beta
MHLPKFQYVAPRKAARAISVQKKSGKFLAGGTDLFVAMKERISCPELLIDLNGISELKGIGWDKKKRLCVGALTTLTQLKENSIVQKHFAILSQTVPLISTPVLQNMGTVGGNLCLDTRCYYYNQSAFLKKRWKPCFKIGGNTCHVVRGEDSCYAVYSGDMAPPLIALGARVKVIGDNSAREIALQRFFSGSGINPNVLKFNEILSEILIPPPPEHSGFSYQKLRLRDTTDFPLLGVSVFLNLEERNGRCKDIRLVLGAVGPSPLVVKEAVQLVCGKEITPKLIDEVSQIAWRVTHPVANIASSPKYRRDMVRVFTKNAIEEALSRINNNANP